MSFTASPALDDLEVIAALALEALPEEIVDQCENLAIRVEDWPDDGTLLELGIEDEYELIALYKSGREIAPGIETKSANDDDALFLYRRPLLDMWCETGDDLAELVRRVIIEELGKNFDLSEEEIEILTRQGNR